MRSASEPTAEIEPRTTPGYATVRVASPMDLQAVRAVASASWHATYAGLLSAPAIDTFLRRAYSDYSLLATLNGGGLWVLEEDGRVVAYMRLSMQGEVGFVDALYVTPTAQGCGYGRRLWENAHQWFAARGAREVRLTVACDNEHARGFYRHLGFEERGTHRGTLLGEPLDECLCVRPLLQGYLF